MLKRQFIETGCGRDVHRLLIRYFQDRTCGDNEFARKRFVVGLRQVVKGLAGPSAMKAVLADLFGFPDWSVRAPLEPLPSEIRARLSAAMAELLA